MSVVKVGSKFRIIIPADFRMLLGIQEGDLMEVAAADGGILFRPKKVADRTAAAKRIKEALSNATSPPEDAGKSADEIIDEMIADIAMARRERRNPKRAASGRPQPDRSTQRSSPVAFRPREIAMPVVKIQRNFGITLPAELRKGLDIQKGDLMDISTVDDGILLRLLKTMDYGEVIMNEFRPFLDAMGRLPQYAEKTEDEIIGSIIADMEKAGRKPRKSKA